jgi:hypothetical protein
MRVPASCPHAIESVAVDDCDNDRSCCTGVAQRVQQNGTRTVACAAAGCRRLPAPRVIHRAENSAGLPHRRHGESGADDHGSVLWLTFSLPARARARRSRPGSRPNGSCCTVSRASRFRCGVRPAGKCINGIHRTRGSEPPRRRALRRGSANPEPRTRRYDAGISGRVARFHSLSSGVPLSTSGHRAIAP